MEQQKESTNTIRENILDKSVLQICGENRHSCGYCNKEVDTSVSFGIISTNMSAEDYHDLMMIGWRRSGNYFYKPTMHVTCCPQYPIRLPVTSFKPTKSQKKVIKTMQKFLLSDLSQDDNNNNNKEKELTIELEKSSFTEEKFELYKQYQISIHKEKPEKVTKKGFSRFLVDSPLHDLRTKNEIFASPSKLEYGSFHQVYRVDGKILAVGVLDILPTGLSSVYLFHDPNYRHLALGKYTAMKEIEFCQQHNFPYYYMGFYIHSCEKMRYKGEYQPSELLCPTTFSWFPYSSCTLILDQFSFSPFNPVLANMRREIYPVLNEEENSKISENDVKIEQNKDLNQFSPQFHALKSEKSEWGTIPLDIGVGRVLYFNDFREREKAIISDYFNDILKNMSVDILKRFVIKLY